MHAAAFRRWEPEQSPEALSRALFEGELVVFEGRRIAQALRAHAVAMVEAAFGDEPERAEWRMSAAAFRQAALEVRKTVEADPTIQQLWRRFLVEVGYADDDVLCDRLRLRAVPARRDTDGRLARPLPVHRDTWASGITAQVNWWMPLYPLAREQTMVLWPALFATPVPNTAAEWDYDAARTQRGYPLLPEAMATPSREPVAVVIEPGTVLAFSGAHLHASRSEGAERARFSLDTRTVWQPDVDAGRGAPDVDGAGRAPRWEMFERTATGRGHRAERSASLGDAR